MIRLPRWLPLLIGVLIVSGCQSTGPGRSGDPGESLENWRQHQAAMADLRKWNLKGRMAVRSGDRGDSASLLWAVDGESQDIELYGPFGGGRIRISASPGTAELRDTRGNTIAGASVSEVLDRRLGWQVPFDDLAYWVRGIPSEEAGDIRVDASGYLQSFRQDNWLVEYQEYQRVGEYWMPRKMRVDAVAGSMEIYDDEGRYIGDELSVKMVLKKWWQLAAEPAQ